MKTLTTLSLALLLISCGQPRGSTPDDIPKPLYKQGDIVCLKLTNQKVLVSNVDVDYESTYWVIIDYTNPRSPHPRIKNVNEFELCSCDNIKQLKL
jgi:glutamyl-tRNA reductase